MPKAPENKVPKALPLPQLRVLRCLSEEGASNGLTRGQIAEWNGWKSPRLCTFPLSGEKRPTRTNYVGLVDLGYVKEFEADDDGKKETLFTITEEGRRALENAEKQA
jgi:hypothetical protein